MIKVAFGVSTGPFTRDCLSPLQELIRVGFAIDAIEIGIESLKKLMADLEACHECLRFGVTSSSRFED